jgi:hypothetical protein
MRRMTRYEAGQFITLAASLLFFGALLWQIFGDRGFGVWSLLIYVLFPGVEFAFHFAVFHNWRGITDEHVAREQERAQQAGYRYTPAPEQRRATLQRMGKWMSILWGTLTITFLVGTVVLYVGGRLS